MTIISGGQTGADQGGLQGARDAGARTGGTAPRGWRTENGPAPWLAEFGLIESPHASYAARTRANVEAADGTVIFGNALSSGSARTDRYCTERSKPALRIPVGQDGKDIDREAERLAEWMQANRIRVLNVAGNRESNSSGIGDFVRKVVFRALAQLQDHDEP